MVQEHEPVLLAEAVGGLAVRSGGVYVDGNVGLGGHAAAVLAASAPDGRLIGFDWDAAAIERAAERLASFGDRVELVRDNFTALGSYLEERGLAAVDGILLDLGISSFQLDASGRGFSFLRDEPLDMRMDQRRPATAADLVNTLSERELADILYYYGEERQARRIAARIVARRQQARITTTAALAEIVAQAVPRRFHPRRIHVATRTFQALRIAVNGELDNLRALLRDAWRYLKPGGRICVISFHSLEDRLVKAAFAGAPALKALTKRPITPTAAEKRRNPRSRSARLRIAVRREVGHGA